MVPWVSLALPAAQPTSYVTDLAGMLSQETKNQLELELSQFAQTTGHEVAVVLVANLEGDYIEHYAVQLFEQWKIGKKGSDNGVLFLIARDEHKLRIEVGYWLEGALPDATAGKIISDIVTPQFKLGAYDRGVTEGVDAILKTIQGEPMREPVKSDSNLVGLLIGNAQVLLFILYGVFMFFASVLGRSKSWWMGGVVGAVIAGVVTLVAGLMYTGLVALIVLVPLGLLLDYIVSRGYTQSVAKGSRPPWWTGGGGIGGGRSSSGGFGGFGGGRSGGGGASGSW
jgi:uncharacterized protein